MPAAMAGIFFNMDVFSAALKCLFYSLLAEVLSQRKAIYEKYGCAAFEYSFFSAIIFAGTNGLHASHHIKMGANRTNTWLA